MKSWGINFSYRENGVLRTKKKDVEAETPAEAEKKLRKEIPSIERIWKIQTASKGKKKNR